MVMKAKKAKNAKNAPPKGVEVEELLVRVVSMTVRAFADVCDPGDSKQLEFESWLYENLAVNCQKKAKLAAGFASDYKKLSPRETTI
jgi:hypothetical protein